MALNPQKNANTVGNYYPPMDRNISVFKVLIQHFLQSRTRIGKLRKKIECFPI